MFMHTPERMAAVVQDHRRVPGRRPLQHEADHAAAAEGALRPREERARRTSRTSSRPSSTRRRTSRESQLLLGGKIDAQEGGGRDGEDRAADPPDAAEADRELRHVGAVVQVDERTSSAVPDVERPPGTVARSVARRRRLRLGRVEPLVWIAPAVAVVVFVFGYSMVELVRTSLRYEGHWTASRTSGSRGPTRRSGRRSTHNVAAPLAVPVLVVARAAPLGAPVRGAARLALPPRARLPAVRPADPRRRRRSSASCSSSTGSSTSCCAASGSGARSGLARPAAVGALDDDGRDRLEGARLRVILFLARLLSRPRRHLRGGADRRRALLPAAPLRSRSRSCRRDRRSTWSSRRSRWSPGSSTTST